MEVGEIFFFQFFYDLLTVFCTTASSWCVRFESPCIIQALVFVKFTEFLILYKILIFSTNYNNVGSCNNNNTIILNKVYNFTVKNLIIVKTKTTAIKTEQ
jgi:hypothetical protein